ncbi:MAG: hypothetical protein NTV02_00415 [Candidatus Zambryskibacteria bacterium]|nr:hypothetical protein [Candidatus Zambryskibacteria bacterium]
MKETYIIIAACILVGALLLSVFFKGEKPVPLPDYMPDQSTATTTPVVMRPNILTYGEVKNVRLGQTLRFADFSLKLTRVESDSRCPANAKCAWAGTTIVSGEFVGATGTTTKVIELDKITAFGSATVSLVEVLPLSMQTHKIINSEYRFTLDVQKKNSVVNSFAN